MTELAAQIFVGCVGFLAIGLLWFEVLRPMLVSYGVIRGAANAEPPVNTSTDGAPDDYVVIERSRLVSFLASINTNTDTYQAQEAQPTAPNVTERDHVIWLAGKKKVDGSWVLSANAIYDLVRGNRNEVMGWIREARADATDEPQALTPYAGRPYNPKAYQDDPELAYTAPPK